MESDKSPRDDERFCAHQIRTIESGERYDCGAQLTDSIIFACPYVSARHATDRQSGTIEPCSDFSSTEFVISPHQRPSLNGERG